MEGAVEGRACLLRTCPTVTHPYHFCSYSIGQDLAVWPKEPEK